MRILGVYYGHNSTAVLLENGVVKDCISEERFTGKKNQTGIPKQSIKYILKKNKLKPSDINKIAIPVKTSAPIYASEDTKRDFFISVLNAFFYYVPFVKSTYGFVSFYNPSLRWLGETLYKLFAQTIGSYTANKERTNIANFVKVPIDKIEAFDHHTSHAYAAYYASPYNKEKSLVITLDAEGDGICASVNVFNKDYYERLTSILASNSPGLMYAGVTKHLCMKVGEHEYKVMGLAPYAKEHEIKKFYPRVQNLFLVSGLNFRSAFDMRQIGRFLKEEMSDVRFDILSGVFQKILEDTITDWVASIVETTGIQTVCFAGGVFMNVKLNQKITEIAGVKKVFFLPSCGDESSPIGACYQAFEPKSKIQPINSIYWGMEFSEKEIASFIKSKKLDKKYKISHHRNIEEKIAQLLFKGEIVGRLSGRMEWGARALGNRSILANPVHQDVVVKINEQIKDRDFWMPFTPSILEERIDDYIVNPKHIAAPYMIMTFNTTDLGKRELKAAMHPYDFTIRPQVVIKSWNPKYHKIISNFQRLTGVGGVLNTSFNLHGLPVVSGPKEALYAFENSGLQYLCLENFLISKV
ncbi:hypothetical protein KAZ57_02935 [Patescibacteria group bacterium]|nr:hypothetical protein [Patescibacteria group bacterium]